MSRLVSGWLYPGALTVADIAIGTLCYGAGAVGIAVFLWLTAATVCVGVLVNRQFFSGIARPV